MPRYQLVDKVTFVDAICMISPGKPPVELPIPHILDQRAFEITTKKATYTQLTPAEAFITRFIVMGVDTKDIPDIFASETGTNSSNSQTAVQGVVTLLTSHGYLEDRGPRNYSDALNSNYPRDGIQDKYTKHTLDFQCNWYGTGQNKIPY